MKKFLIALVAAFTVGTLSFATDTTAPAADAHKTTEVKTDGAAPATATETKTEETTTKTAKKMKKKKAEKKADETKM